MIQINCDFVETDKYFAEVDNNLRPREMTEGSDYEALVLTEAVDSMGETQALAVYSRLEAVHFDKHGFHSIDLRLLHAVPDEDIRLNLALAEAGHFAVHEDEDPVELVAENDEDRLVLLGGYLLHITDEDDYDAMKKVRLANSGLPCTDEDWIEKRVNIYRKAQDSCSRDFPSGRPNRSDCPQRPKRRL